MHFPDYFNEPQTIAQSDLCPICGSVALHRHFGGVRSCKGCSAFFRRSILFSKSYRCLRNQKCFVHKGANKHGCQACRFKRCLELGMKISAVSSSKRGLKHLVHSDNIGSLKQIMRCWNSCYIARYKAMLELNNNNKECLLQSHSRITTTPSTYDKALQIESIVLKEYVKNYGFLPSYDLDFKTKLQLSFTTTWLTMRLLSINIKMNSIRYNRIHFLDESYLDIDLDRHYDFYQKYHQLWSVETMARSSIRLATHLNTICRRFAVMRVCDVEMGISAHYLILKTALQLDTSICMNVNQLISQMFIDLNAYYKSVCEDPVERIGNLMLVLEMIFEAKKTIEEHFRLLELNQLNFNTIDYDLIE